MDSSIGAGYVAVLAVSGSVALLAHQLHKRLLSNFMKQMEFELGSTRSRAKKKVNMVVEETSSDGRSHVKMHEPTMAVTGGGRRGSPAERLESLPLNWQILYKGIIEYNNSIHTIHT